MLEAKAAALNVPIYVPPLVGRDGLLCDFNENLAGCSPRVMERLRSLTAMDLAKYPVRAEGETCLAEFLKVDPEQVLLTNGVDEGLHLLCETYLESGDEALIVVPTFGMYAVYAAAAGARVVTVQAREDFSFPAEAVLKAIGPRTRFIGVASPNNPTGTVTARSEILAVAAAAPQAAVVIDEAYFEFHGETVLGEVGRFDNLFVARTFSKAYALAGLRLGALIGNARQIATVRRFVSPYNVNCVALACLPEALDRECVARYVGEIREGRQRLAHAMQELGFQTWPSGGNFILMRVGERVGGFVTAMERQGVRLRSRDLDPGCAGCVRITVGPPEAVDNVIAAARAVVGAGVGA